MESGLDKLTSMLTCEKKKIITSPTWYFTPSNVFIKASLFFMLARVEISQQTVKRVATRISTGAAKL